MSDEILELTSVDHKNYIALCNIINGVLPKQEKRLRGCDDLSKSTKLSIKKNQLEQQAHSCLDCFKTFTAKLRPTFDHIIPRKYGGRINRHNVHLLCRECNIARDKLKKRKLIQIIEGHFGEIQWTMIEKYPVIVDFNLPI